MLNITTDKLQINLFTSYTNSIVLGYEEKSL